MDKNELKEAVKEALNEGIPVEEHEAHHDWIKSKVAKEKRRQEIWDKVKIQVASTGVIAVIIYVSTVVWDALHNPHH